MKHKKSLAHLLFLLLLLSGVNTLYAGTIDLTQRLYTKDSIVNGAKIRVCDNARSTLLSTLYNKSYSARVMLSYNRHGRSDLGPLSSGNYWCRKVTYTIEFFDDNYVRQGSAVTGNILRISNTGTPVYEAVHVFNQTELNAGHAVVTITNVTDSCSGTVPQDIVMELTVKENSVLYMPSSNGFTMETDGSNTLYWTYCHGAESYEVEWVYYDDKSTEPSSTNRFLEKEPVRINTRNQFYKLNLTYPKGNVYCRVRGVGKFLGSNGETTDKYTNWIYPSPDYIAITTSFEQDKNWHYVASYAEDAKNKKVITYYDGSLRNRQVQTNLSSDSTILVAETKYDHEGRGVVNILPVPVKTSSLSYKTNFNTFTGGKHAYDSEFDPTYGALSSQQPGLSNISEASKYYSNSNNVENTNRNYLPEANGYTYTLTQYMEDGTGRVSRQSGAGEAFRILHPDSVNKHYTSYIYGSPNETELRRLFGSNVGEISHYQKNAVIDPNGQASISYLDLHDRVIATALAGDAPANVLPIPSNKIEPLTVSLDGTNVIDTNNFISSSVNKIVNVKAPTTYYLKYSLNGVINQTGDFYGLCKTCKYDLEINVISPRGSNIYNVVKNNIAAASVNCPADSSFSKPNLVDDTLVFTQIGTYTVYKKLTLSSGYIDTMLTSIATFPGFPDSSAYILQGIQAVDTTMCGFTCEDYPEDTTECSGDLAYKYTCASLRGQMKDQLSPGGQYYENTTVMTAALSGSGTWTISPVPSVIELMDSALFRSKNFELNDAWIENLVRGHPEFCHYKACLLDSNSRNYDLRMAAIPNWTVASSSGYLYPLSTTSGPGEDPFYMAMGIGNSYKTTMLSALDDFVINKGLNPTDFPNKPGSPATPDPNGDPKGDLWDFVSNPRVYFTDPVNFSYLPTAEEKWQMFHALYLGLKQNHVKAWKLAMSPSCPYLNQSYAVVKDPFKYMPTNVNAMADSVNNVFNYACNDSTQCKANVKLWMKLLESKCSDADNDRLTGSDSIAVANYLYAYCDSTCGRFNPFHLLLKEHIKPGSLLGLANSLLGTHGCSLDSIAVENPYLDTCVADYITSLGFSEENLFCPTCNYPAPPPNEICFITGIDCKFGDRCNDSIIDPNDVIRKCILQQKAIGRANGLMLWQRAVDDFRAQVLKKYYNQCFSHPFEEHFNYRYNHQEYHYTLYYYDQAGNLIQTVPPAGVNPLKTSAFDSTGRYIPGNEPQHHLITKYRYNTLEQLLWQDTPDADSAMFFYDSKGQLRLSQNAKQKANSASSVANVYSYTKYDSQGRITEVGEVRAHDKTPSYMSDHNKFKEVLAILDNTAFPEAAKGLREKTITDYDLNLSGSFENLRGRVASVRTIFTEGSSTPETVTSYSYDPHGNVKKLQQEITGFATKTVDYEYDLISGKVNKVFYQKGQADQFTHLYHYDADNRITSVYTSSDQQIWIEEARYFYYKHGPLARAELGRDKVQGLDYYYTLQGWLKGVNTPDPRRLDGASNRRVMTDPGHDGISLGTATPYQTGIPGATTRHLNKYVAQDEFAFVLGYYDGDHISIHSDGKKGLASNSLFTSSGPIKDGMLPSIPGKTKGLFNGNIPVMVSQVHSLGSLPGFTEENTGIRANAYRYDQLNRLKEARSIDHNNAGTAGWASRSNTINSAAFDARYSYDPNGNIDTARVNGTTSSLMDDLKYHYDEYTDSDSKVWYRSNRLYHVNDAMGASSGSDLGNQGTFTASATSPYELTPSPGTINSANNYRYDPIGNLIHDSSEEIDTIKWTVYGKVKSVIRTSGSTKAKLEFVYDGAGNRIMKKVTPTGGGNVVTTYYLRDASGNVMATYESSLTSYSLEYPVYGSSRVGMYQRTSAPVAPAASGPYTANSYEYKPTLREYELSNHLGNVYVTTSGLKFGVDTTSDGRADYYMANVVTAHDYYPFGASIPSRSYTSGSVYRYGFNAKENDQETGWQDYGMRMYNPKLSRFFTVDPIARQYPQLTPYQFASNKPIAGVDLDGLEFLGAGYLVDKLAEGAEELGLTRTSGFIRSYGHSLMPDPLHMTQQTVEKVRQGNYTEAAKDFDPTGVSRVPDLIETGKAAYNGDEQAQGTLLGYAPALYGGFKSVRKVSPGASVTEPASYVDLYRGVNENHPGYTEALKGKATPRGGNATPLEHNTKTTESPYTSWTTDPEVAKNFALRPNGSGIVLNKKVPVSQTVESPNLKNVNLKQTPGKVVSESEVLIKGKVTGASTTKVNP